MADSAREIEKLIHTYAERIDAGDFGGVGELFAHGRIHGVPDGPPESVFRGAAAVRGMYESMVRLYEDGTPKTKHFTTNVVVDVDDAAGTAQSRANYCVTQATPELPLQIVVTGRYRDTFHRVDGRWCFETRTMFVDQVGDVSRHLET